MTVTSEEVTEDDIEMPKLSMSVSKAGIRIILNVPVRMSEGQPEPDWNDKNGLQIIINPDYRRIWMAYYYPHLTNSPGSGNWYCKNCSCKGDRFYMKAHVDIGACARNAVDIKKPKYAKKQ